MGKVFLTDISDMVALCEKLKSSDPNYFLYLSRNGSSPFFLKGKFFANSGDFWSKITQNAYFEIGEDPVETKIEN